MKISEMDRIYLEFREKDVLFYCLYTREPHPGEKFRDFDFYGFEQPATFEDRIRYAKILKEERNQIRPVLIDTFGEDCIQKRLDAGMSNSLIVIDKEGKVALWQEWSHAGELREKLQDMTGTERKE